MILMQYTLKMCIVCHSASVIIESFKVLNEIDEQTLEPKYAKY